MSGPPQEQLLINSIFFLYLGHVFFFLCMLYNFWLKIGYFEYYNVASLEIRFSPLSRAYCLLLILFIVVYLFTDFYELFYKVSFFGTF